MSKQVLAVENTKYIAHLVYGWQQNAVLQYTLYSVNIVFPKQQLPLLL